MTKPCFSILPSAAMGRIIKRRPSQQQIRSSSIDPAAASKGKMPRSRSEKVLGSKKTCFSGQRDTEEDGFSVQELAASLGK